MRPFLLATVTLLILAVDRGATIVVTRKLLPQFKYHCDPGDPSSASKCQGKTKYGLKEGFGFQRETQKNNFFCLKFKMCANYAYGTMMLAIRSAWEATGMLGKTDRRFPGDKIAALVKNWYNRPETIKTLKQIREEEREEKAEAAAAARAAAAAAAASTTAATATKGETTENASDANSESPGEKIFRDEPVSEDNTPGIEADIGDNSPTVQEPGVVKPVPSVFPVEALRKAIHSWRN